MTDLMRALFNIAGDTHHTLEAAVAARHLDAEWKAYAPAARFAERYCSNCDFEGTVELVNDLAGDHWDCPDCDLAHFTDDVEDVDDPDGDRDRWLDDLA